MLFRSVKNISNKFIMSVSRLLFVLYLILLVYFLFFSEHYGRNIVSDQYRYNLTPFKEVKRYIEYRNQIGSEGFIVNIFGNILAFAPFGLVLPIISPENRKLLNIVLLSFEFSLTVELLQLIFKVGIFDVDDLIMNTLGGLIGGICFLIGRVLLRVLRRR